jgi:hypothetical protein
MSRPPGEGDVFPEISQGLGECLLVAASQSGLIVVADERVEVGVSHSALPDEAAVAIG